MKVGAEDRTQSASSAPLASASPLVSLGRMLGIEGGMSCISGRRFLIVGFLITPVLVNVLLAVAPSPFRAPSEGIGWGWQFPRAMRLIESCAAFNGIVIAWLQYVMCFQCGPHACMYQGLCSHAPAALFLFLHHAAGRVRTATRGEQRS